MHQLEIRSYGQKIFFQLEKSFAFYLNRRCSVYYLSSVLFACLIYSFLDSVAVKVKVFFSMSRLEYIYDKHTEPWQGLNFQGSLGPKILVF